MTDIIINGSNALIFDNHAYVSNGSKVIKYNSNINVISEINLTYNIIDMGYKSTNIYIIGDYDLTILDSNLNIIYSYHNDMLNPFENFLVLKNENSVFIANRYRAFKLNIDTSTIAWAVDYPICYGSRDYNTLASTMSIDETDSIYTSINRYDTCSRYRFFYSDGTIKNDIAYNAGNNYTWPIIISNTHYFIGKNTGSGGTAQKPLLGFNKTTNSLDYTLDANKFHIGMFLYNNLLYTSSANSSAFGFYNLSDLTFTTLGSSPFTFTSRCLMTASQQTIYVGISSGSNIIYNFGDSTSNIYSNSGGFKVAVGNNYIYSPIEYYNGNVNFLNKQDSYNGIFPYNIAILNMGNNELKLILQTGDVCIKSNPPGATITIDGTIQPGKTTALSGTTCTIDNTVTGLIPGIDNHSYDVSLGGYQTVTGNFSITAGVLTEIDIGNLIMITAEAGIPGFLMLGLAVGFIYMVTKKKCSSQYTKEDCNKAGCQWKNEMCIER